MVTLLGEIWCSGFYCGCVTLLRFSKETDEEQEKHIGELSAWKKEAKAAQDKVCTFCQNSIQSAIFRVNKTKNGETPIELQYIKVPDRNNNILQSGQTYCFNRCMVQNHA